MDQHERMLIALGELDVPRVRQLVAVALRAGRGIGYITDQLHRAASHLYHVKGYTEGDFDLSYLILKVGTHAIIGLALCDHLNLTIGYQTPIAICLLIQVGGPMLLTAIHKASGYLPSVGCVYANMRGEVPALLPFIRADVAEIVLANILAKSTILSTNYDLSSLLWHLPMDEVAIESRPSWDPSSNCVLGMCIEHTPPQELALTSLQSVQDLKGKVTQGDSHVASEALVIMAQPYSDSNYSAIPILVIPSCKSMPPCKQVEILQVGCRMLWCLMLCHKEILLSVLYQEIPVPTVPTVPVLLQAVTHVWYRLVADKKLTRS